MKVQGAYTIPKIDVQVGVSFRSSPGPALAANAVVPNAAVRASLGRDLSGGAANVTVNIVAPGTMYGDRLNQLDLRFGKMLQTGQLRSVIQRRCVQCAQREPGAHRERGLSRCHRSAAGGSRRRFCRRDS